MESLVHVVVGAGLQGYFRNSIKSCMLNTPNDVIAIYNSISPSDIPAIDDLFEEWPGRIQLFVQSNKAYASSKTGSLYSAHNLAIEMSQGRYQWIHFLQADMQIIRWPVGTESLLEEVFAGAISGEPKRNRIFCLSVVAPSIGKTGGLNRNLQETDIDGLAVDASSAVNDTGIFSLKAIEAEHFRFKGDEVDVNLAMLRRGYALGILRAPLTAFLPWPAVVRGGRVYGKEQGVSEAPEGAGEHRLLLKERKFFAKPGMTTADASVLWAEDWVVPDGWTCLFPYWLTDFHSFSALKKRIMVCRMLGVSFFSTAGERESRTFRSIFWRQVFPSSGLALLANPFLALPGRAIRWLRRRSRWFGKTLSMK